MMVSIEKVFLRNQQLRNNPHNQTDSPFYKRVRDSMKKRGMVNPLLCIEVGGRYKCCIGNNRYIAALELGFKEVPVQVITSEVPKDMMKETMKYIPTEVEGLPSRRREYERMKK